MSACTDTLVAKGKAIPPKRNEKVEAIAKRRGEKLRTKLYKPGSSVERSPSR